MQQRLSYIYRCYRNPFTVKCWRCSEPNCSSVRLWKQRFHELTAVSQIEVATVANTARWDLANSRVPFRLWTLSASYIVSNRAIRVSESLALGTVIWLSCFSGGNI